MTRTNQNKSFLLEQDLIEQRQHQLFAKIEGNYIRIIQENGTNPKIIRLMAQQRSDYLGITDVVPDYSVRIVKSDNIANLISGVMYYGISFDDGSTVSDFVVKDIIESKIQDLFWMLMVSQVSDIKYTL